MDGDSGRNVNVEMVRSGTARIFHLRQTSRYAQALSDAEVLAKADGLGVWGETPDPLYRGHDQRRCSSCGAWFSPRAAHHRLCGSCAFRKA